MSKSDVLPAGREEVLLRGEPGGAEGGRPCIEPLDHPDQGLS